MKKNIALLLGLVLGLGFVSCSSDDDDDESVNGEGKYLAEELITRYDWKDGKRSDEGTPYQLYKFNANGDYIGGDNYRSGHRVEVTYDDKGDRLEEIVYDLNNLKSITSRYKYEYIYADSGVIVSTYDYNWKNKLVLTYKREFRKIDSDYQLTKWTEIIDSIGKDRGTVSTYSYSGNTETIYRTNLKDGAFSEKIVHEMDGHDNVTKTTISYAKGQISTAEYVNEYDSNGWLLKKTGPTYDDGTTYGYTEYTYNADGTVKKEHCVTRMGTYSEEEYDLEYTYKYKKK